MNSPFVSGHEFYNSDEFKALCKRFGIVWENPTTTITIIIPCEGMVEINHGQFLDKDQLQKQIRLTRPYDSAEKE